jgi:transposase
VESVAGLLWNQWQLSCGTGGSFAVESVAALAWNTQRPKRGRKRLFNAAMHALRMRVEQTFAWEDKFKRLLLRFERIQRRHYGMKLLAYTLINLRKFCGT